MSVSIRPLTMADYTPVIALWQKAEGVGLSGADEAPAIAAYLERNPGMSFAAVTDSGEVVGAVLCGHDGRRGYIYHLAVEPNWRRGGIATQLIDACLKALAEAHIQKCHLFIYAENEIGRIFWQDSGWTLRQDLMIMSQQIDLAVT